MTLKDKTKAISLVSVFQAVANLQPFFKDNSYSTMQVLLDLITALTSHLTGHILYSYFFVVVLSLLYQIIIVCHYSTTNLTSDHR